LKDFAALMDIDIAHQLHQQRTDQGFDGALLGTEREKLAAFGSMTGRNTFSQAACVISTRAAMLSLFAGSIIPPSL